MAKVTGIGGFFFRSRDPDALNRRYAEHLGVVMLESRSYDDPGWFRQNRGETVFYACEPDSDMFGAPERVWAITFRVDDIDGVVADLRAAGIEVQPHAASYPNGRFAELEDPEGNHIQLWEPNEALRRARPRSRAAAGSVGARRGGRRVGGSRVAARGRRHAALPRQPGRAVRGGVGYAGHPGRSSRPGAHDPVHGGRLALRR